jgi:hypothetical protein
MKVAGLDERIAAHAAAVVAGDDRAAEAFVLAGALEGWRAAASQLGARRPIAGYQTLARARIGAHFIAKVRFHHSDGTAMTLLLRWKEAEGGWMIASVEDITTKRSPWSDIPHYSRERGGIANA